MQMFNLGEQLLYYQKKWVIQQNSDKICNTDVTMTKPDAKKSKTVAKVGKKTLILKSVQTKLLFFYSAEQQPKAAEQQLK